MVYNTATGVRPRISNRARGASATWAKPVVVYVARVVGVAGTFYCLSVDIVESVVSVGRADEYGALLRARLRMLDADEDAREDAA